LLQFSHDCRGKFKKYPAYATKAFIGRGQCSQKNVALRPGEVQNQKAARSPDIEKLAVQACAIRQTPLR